MTPGARDQGSAGGAGADAGGAADGAAPRAAPPPAPPAAAAVAVPESPKKARGDTLSSWQMQYPMPSEREEDPSKELRGLYK
jgi:hypothetical protein